MLKATEVELGFDARRDCVSREYTYLFNGSGLRVDLMKRGMNCLKGENNFQNLCKVNKNFQIYGDGTFNRFVIDAKIENDEKLEDFF